MRQFFVVFTLVAVLITGGCNMLDPERPTPQPDTTLFGNVVELTKPGEDGLWMIRVQIGTPRALTRAKEGEGREPPVVEKGLMAEVSVGADSVVYMRGEPAILEAFNPGSEVVIEPVVGTTRMLGTSFIRCEASMVMDFESYATWRLPELPQTDESSSRERREDPASINSDGLEQAPVVLGDGKVLYFSASLRTPVDETQELIGARREGLIDESAPDQVRERSYRTQLGEEGWSQPSLVQIQGLNDAATARVTWVNSDETECLVTVRRSDEPPWFGKSVRSRPRGTWSEPKSVVELGPAGGTDAVYLAGSKTQIAYVSQLFEGGTTDVFLYSPKLGEDPQPLDPRISTPAAEWGPRVGPKGELLFVRGDRQLMLSGENPEELKLPMPHRTLLNQAALSPEGEWVFFCRPNFTPVQIDQDIYVAKWLGGGVLSEPIAVDEWRGAADLD
ncbi:MAG: hypothetical protein GY906_05310 [bacterium]|nr:hypothetical protein [bacterium]